MPDIGMIAVLLVLAVLTALAAPPLIRRYIKNAREDQSRRPQLWDRFYSFDWGETNTNNYGFAPAEGDHPQRFQHQMYRELVRMLKEKRELKPGMKLLEVSCGRGGGLQAFLAAEPGVFDATGLDVASSAIAFCRRTYGENDRLRFVEGSAIDLPFPDVSFDVLINVEASNDYPDRPRFFREVARVLKDDGVFVYTDNFRGRRVDEMKQHLAEAGFEAEFRDITANVAEACRLDSPRRREVIRSRAPLLARLVYGKQLESYAGIEGSNKHDALVDGRRAYLMTAATKR
jgi:ubiquinone/menaquinone biosynthesis C-methylase UbiE